MSLSKAPLGLCKLKNNHVWRVRALNLSRNFPNSLYILALY